MSANKPLGDGGLKKGCFLGASQNCKKKKEEIFSFVMCLSVCLSVCMYVGMFFSIEQLGSHWKDFHEI